MLDRKLLQIRNGIIYISKLRKWKKKLEIFSAPNLHFVAVSNWLAGKCLESSLLGSKNVAVIPNTIAVDEFTFDRRHDADFEIPQDRKVMVMGAARLDDRHSDRQV